MPSCGLGSYGGHSSCQRCPPGTHRNSLKSDDCLPCPAGTHADGHGFVDCDACGPYPFTSVKEGQAHCDAVYVQQVDPLLLIPIVAIVGSAYYLSMSSLTNHRHMAVLLLFSILSVMTCIFDIAYFITARFNSVAMFVFTILGILSPCGGFACVLATSAGRFNNSLPLPSVIWKKCPFTSYNRRLNRYEVIWLRSFNFTPVITWHSDKPLRQNFCGVRKIGDYSMEWEYTDSVPKGLYLLIQWALCIALQLAYVALFLVWCVFCCILLTGWFAYGAWSFQNKTLCIRSEWTRWFYWWRGDENFDKVAKILEDGVLVDEVDVRLLNTSWLTDGVQAVLVIALVCGNAFAQDEEFWSPVLFVVVVLHALILIIVLVRYTQPLLFSSEPGGSLAACKEVPAVVPFTELSIPKHPAKYNKFDHAAGTKWRTWNSKERKSKATWLWHELTLFQYESTIIDVLLEAQIDRVTFLADLAEKRNEPYCDRIVQEIKVHEGEGSKTLQKLWEFIQHVRAFNAHQHFLAQNTPLEQLRQSVWDLLTSERYWEIMQPILGLANIFESSELDELAVAHKADQLRQVRIEFQSDYKALSLLGVYLMRLRIQADPYDPLAQIDTECNTVREDEIGPARSPYSPAIRQW